MSNLAGGAATERGAAKLEHAAAEGDSFTVDMVRTLCQIQSMFSE